MKTTKGNHLTHMLLGGAGILTVLLVAGVPLGTSLRFALVLACPLMMLVMMLMMGRAKDGHGGGHGGGAHDHGPGGRTEAQNQDREPLAVDAERRR